MESKLATIFVCLFSFSIDATKADDATRRRTAFAEGEATISQSLQDLIARQFATVAHSVQTADRTIVPMNHECFYHTNLSCNSTISDTVNIYGCRTDNFNYFNMHRLFLTSGVNLTISTTFPGYSPLLVLFDDKASPLRTSSASRSQTASTTYPVTVSGYYVVTVGPIEQAATGNYTLSLACASAATPPPSTCNQTSTTMCLNNDRFAVSATWRANDGTSGNGQAVRLTGDTGYFTFFSASNVEHGVPADSGH